MWILDSIPHGIDMLIGGLQVLVHIDSSCLSQLEACFLCQAGLGSYPDGEEDKVSLQRYPRLQVYGQLSFFLREGLDCLLQVKLYSVLQEMLMHEGSHREVDRCHHLIGHLDDGDFGSRFLQILGHL